MNQALHVVRIVRPALERVLSHQLHLMIKCVEMIDRAIE
jgi:hypothetical protein